MYWFLTGLSLGITLTLAGFAVQELLRGRSLPALRATSQTWFTDKLTRRGRKAVRQRRLTARRQAEFTEAASREANDRITTTSAETDNVVRVHTAKFRS